jgi:phenylalanyl-tRNA synthetase beta chain
VRLKPTSTGRALLPRQRTSAAVGAGCGRRSRRLPALLCAPTDRRAPCPKSPLFYRLRLQRLGVRALSNVVDATNLALLQFGHPLHAFDLGKLAGQQLVVRRAKAGEKLKTLDGQERELLPEDLLIADAEQGVAVAGVMGGQTSEVCASDDRPTARVRVLFASEASAEPRRRLKLHTEASHRFERGTDPNALAEVADACAELIIKLSGGRLAAPPTDVYRHKIPTQQLTLRPERTTAILGSFDPVSDAKGVSRSARPWL